MTGRERIRAAMRFQPVDAAPLQYYYTPVGYFEHGEKLNELYASLPGDFEPFRRMPVPRPGPECFDDAGRYHAFETDDWGVTWEHRIFGVAGIPCRRPLSDLTQLTNWRPPTPPVPGSPAFAHMQAQVHSLQQNGYYAQISCGSLYERMISLCGDENVLCGIALQEPALERLADKIAEHCHACVQAAVLCGADGIALGDDYGSERSLLFSPAAWRRFFKPRWDDILRPAREANLNIHFHSCGQIGSLLPDLAELGVRSIWPQLPVFDMPQLANQCRSLGLAVAIHTDRARTMTTGTPDQVRELVLREYETFRIPEGGAWFYVEADNGFPFENLRALVETIAQWR